MDDGFTCYHFKAISDKAPDLGTSPIMLQIVTLAPLIFAKLFHTSTCSAGFLEGFDSGFPLACS